MLRVVVASKNPVKIKAASDGLASMFTGLEFTIEGTDVDSGVSDQPLSDQETLNGALNRAKGASHKIPNADFWIGIEGGIDQHETAMEAFAWIVVINQGIVGQARTASFQLPAKVADLIRAGMELGEADDIVFGTSASKTKNGAVGLLTRDVIDRTGLYKQAVILACIPHLNKTLY